MSTELSLIETIEKNTEKAIDVFTAIELRFIELKKQYSSLKINGISDKEGYELVKAAVAELRTMRTSSEKDRKALKSPFKSAGEKIDAIAKRIEVSVKELETPLKSMLDAIDEEKESIKKQKIEAENKRFAIRTKELLELGGVVEGDNFVIGVNSFEISVVKGVDDEIYESDIKPVFQSIFDTKEEIRKAEEKAKKEQEEADRIAREELERKQREIEEREAKLKQLEIEAENRRIAEEKKLFDAKVARIEAIGYLVGTTSIKGFGVSIDIEKMQDIEGLIVYLEKQKELFVKAEQDRIKEEQEEAIRKAVEQEKENARLAEEQRIAAEKKKKEDDEKAEIARKEAEEIEKAKMADKDKFTEYVNQLLAIELPTFKSSVYNKKKSIILEKLNEIKEL